MNGYSTSSYSSITWPHAPNQYIPALTGLRAVAASLVFLHHYNPAPSGTMAYTLFEQGYIGVSIFFVLSGFLIYYRYAQAYLTQSNWSWRQYLWRRLVRIYPLYELLFLLTVGTQTIWRQPMSVHSFWLNSTLLKGLFDSSKFSGIAQSWSLTVELCFYLLAPLLFIGLHRWGAIRLTFTLMGIGLIGWVITDAAFTTENLTFVLFYTFFGRSFEFVVGMALARRWKERSLPSAPSSTRIGLCMLLTCLFGQAYVTRYTSQPVYLISSEVVTYNLVLPISIGFALSGLIQGKTVAGWLLTRPLLQAAGRSSYAFYLIHIGVVANGLQRLGLTNRWVLFGSLVGIAHSLYHVVEKPLYHYLIRRSSAG